MAPHPFFLLFHLFQGFAPGHGEIVSSVEEAVRLFLSPMEKEFIKFQNTASQVFSFSGSFRLLPHERIRMASPIPPAAGMAATP